MKNSSSVLAAIACTCALTGCAMFKKAPVVAASPTLGVPALPALPALPAATSTESQPKPPDDDGLRTGDLLVMPKDGEYRATHPVLPKVDAGAGTVIVTPPSAAKPRPPGKAEE